MVLLAGCASSTYRAPVEERANGSRTPVATAPAATPAETPKPLPGAENAGKPGYYTVRQGDTLIRIGLESGQNWRDIVKWNNLDNPNVVEVGQVLRVVPPGIDPSAVATRGVSSSTVQARPLDAKPAPAASAPATATAGAAASAPAPAASPAPVVARIDDDELSWLWPASGSVLAAFDEAKNKGLAIGGKAGDPVVAAADGRVVYAGSGLRGYGNLVIIKHNNTYLTAYAHNQALLVKEDQAVRRGQKIAEMGSTDADRVQLHFEVRKQGKPVDPAKLLPPR
jgi:lipoprotein NlpD